MSSKVPGMLATTSLDGLIKIWDTSKVVDNAPLLVSHKNAKAVNSILYVQKTCYLNVAGWKILFKKEKRNKENYIFFRSSN